MYMNPNGQFTPQQPPQQPSGGVPPVAPSGWQQPQAAPTQPQPGPQPPQEFTPNTPGMTAANYSVDYLNQIAPKEQKTVNRFAVIALIGGVLISALFAVILLSSSGGPNANEQLAPIASRVATLKSATEAQQPHLRDTKLAEANAALSSSLSTMNTEIQGIIKERKIKTNDKSAAGKKETAYSEKLVSTLDQSYQRGTLDTIYTSQMTYELTVLKSKLTKLKRSTKAESLTTFADNGITNIDTILRAYESAETAESP